MLLSIGDQVQPGSYRLHSVFRRAVNYRRRGRLVCVVDETIGPGPLNIVLPSPGRASVPASPVLSGEVTAREDARPPAHARLQVTGRSVQFAGRTYNFSARHRYCSQLELHMSDRFRPNLATLQATITDHAPPTSLAFLLDGARLRHFRTAFDRAYAGQIQRGVRQLFRGQLLTGIRQLRGCGLGLTPGGDDFIAGLLFALHVHQQLHGGDRRPLLRAVFRAARGENVFSNSFLALACRGLAFGRLKDLLLALTAGPAAAVRKTARKLLAVGNTSGADLATGLVLTLQNVRRFETKRRVGVRSLPWRAD
jgi:hypothetical protein